MGLNFKFLAAEEVVRLIELLMSQKVISFRIPNTEILLSIYQRQNSEPLMIFADSKGSILAGLILSRSRSGGSRKTEKNTSEAIGKSIEAKTESDKIVFDGQWIIEVQHTLDVIANYCPDRVEEAQEIANRKTLRNIADIFYRAIHA